MSPYSSVSCNLCGADDTVLLESRARWGERMHNVICRRCGLVYASPRIDREELDQFYRRRVYPEFLGADGQFTERLTSSSAKDATATFRYFTQGGGVEWRDQQVLEIGCGLGHFLAMCRDAGAHVQGVELDGLYADYAERVQRLPIVRNYVEQVEFQQLFDVIALFHVVEHLEDPVQLLESLHRLLAPNGRLLIEVPNLAGPWRIPPAEFFRVEHLFNFTFETLSQLLRRAGFEVVARDHDPFLVRVVARSAPERKAPDLAALAGECDRMRRHLAMWRWRARLFQPWYAARRLVLGARRPGPPA